jgi:hypothetical protein
MKFIKIIFVTLVGIIAILLIAAFFVPKEYTVSVDQTIKKSKKEVFDYVKLIKNQEKYSVWILDDNTTKIEYTGTDGTVGFIAAWKSDKNNEGAQEITEVVDGDRVAVDLRFKKPFESNQKAATIVTAVNENETIVTSQFYGKDKYPMNLFSLIGKKVIKDAMTRNLANLKVILEK